MIRALSAAALLLMVLLTGCASAPSSLQVTPGQPLPEGDAVFVSGDANFLGSGDPARAVKMITDDGLHWSLPAKTHPGRVTYFVRGTGPAEWEDAETRLVIGTENHPPAGDSLRSVVVHYEGVLQNPVLVHSRAGQLQHVPLADGHATTEAAGQWSFRVEGMHGGETGATPIFRTPLERVWIRGEELFAYDPPKDVSEPRVVKHEAFSEGRLSTRPVYVYLPRGYDSHQDKTYPVVLMHDGQNVFEEYAGDSFAGSWRADETATRLIAEGRMAECIIVGVANGQADRLVEYMPPWVTYREMSGIGDQTMAYYFEDVLPWVAENYRVRTNRDSVAMVGSSLGGLISLYAAYEYPHRVSRIGALSPALWPTGLERDEPVAIERWGAEPKPDVTVWLDSGTRSMSDLADDMKNTLALRDAMLRQGFVLGDDLQHHVYPRADHSERAWSARLDDVFEFLMPPDQFAAD